jgi:hypothetical protein
MGPDGSTPVGAVDLTTVDLGGVLYNYSDMTGSTLHGAPENGSWEVLHDSGVSATNWGKVSWNAKVVGDGFVKVTVASSEDGVSFGPSQDASNGVDLTVADGRILQVAVAHQRSNAGVSPILYDLTVAVGNEAPNCSKAAPSVASLWPPNHKFERISIVGVTEPEGGGTPIQITGIRQDEPVDDKADGNTSPDGQGVGTASAEVRAERSGKGDGRVYHISFTATDAGGLTCSGTVQVGVPHDKKDTPIDGGPIHDSTVP